jgi:predicted naringenin-chalcone synthase
MSKLDILAFECLDADKHLLRVTNEDFRNMVHEHLASHLTAEQVQLYDKLLQSDRSRYIASPSIHQNVTDGYAERYARYRHNNSTLTIACVDALLEKAGVDRRSIRAVVSNTTVGGMIPNLTSVIGNHLDLGSETRVIDLGYMGCATALLALSVIENELKPGEIGLIVSSEMTSVMVNLLADHDASLVANTVFGDGVGAFLVAKRPHRERAFLRIRGHASSVLMGEKALSAITYEANAVYHEIRLSSTIPEVAAQGVRHVLEPLVRKYLATWLDKFNYLLNKKIPKWQRHVDYAVLHTAGNKVLEGLTQSLELSADQVKHNFDAFRRYGNTSSASIYYALGELTKDTHLQSGQTLLFLGYGSGFLTRGCVMEVIEHAHS